MKKKTQVEMQFDFEQKIGHVLTIQLKINSPAFAKFEIENNEFSREK